MKTLRIGKGLQATFLGVYTSALLVVTLIVQGGPGVRTNLAPFEDIRRLAARARYGIVFSSAFYYALVGIAANLLMFAIWAFLAWKFLDAPERTPWRNHLDVVLTGTLFSIGIETIQLFLPSRAADVNDVFWNVLGTLVGSAAAHAHKSLRIEWD